MRRIGRKIGRPSPAMIVAMVALFVALGGGAYAGVTLGPNSVGHTQIKPGAVRSSEVKNGSIRHNDVKDDTLLSRDIHDGTLEYKDFAELPAARVYKDTDTTIAQATQTALEYNEERFDTMALHSNGEPSRLTAPVSGLYEITGQVDWDSLTGGGQRIVWIRMNGDTDLAIVADVQDNVQAMSQNLSTLYYLAEDDYVEIYVFHNGGNANIDVKRFGNRSPEFMMHWVGPYEPLEEEE